MVDTVTVVEQSSSTKTKNVSRAKPQGKAASLGVKPGPVGATLVAPAKSGKGAKSADGPAHGVPVSNKRPVQKKTNKSVSPVFTVKGGVETWRLSGDVLHREDGPALRGGGVERWYRLGKLHRLDGPAVIADNGLYQHWYRYGKRHREDGPAIVDEREGIVWYHLGKIHRVEGPAVVLVNGFMAWYRSGKLHREGGPAVMKQDGTQEWWLKGKKIKTKNN